MTHYKYKLYIFIVVINVIINRKVFELIIEFELLFG
jgi:hypothetical protein